MKTLWGQQLWGQPLWWGEESPTPVVPDTLSIDIATFNPSLVDWESVDAVLTDTETIWTCFSDNELVDPLLIDIATVFDCSVIKPVVVGSWNDAGAIVVNLQDAMIAPVSWVDDGSLNVKWELDTVASENWIDTATLNPDFVDSEVISPSRFGMTAFNNSLKPIVRGDTRKVERTFTGLPTGITINKAWLTVKTTPSTSDPGLFQLEITTSGTSSGQITDASTNDGQLGMYFVINGTQSASATGGAEYVYDIQVKDASSGAIHTLVMGTVTFYDGVTGATS